MFVAVSAIAIILAWMFLISFLLSLPVMLLWDAVIPAIFHLPEITWFQAWCLTLLCGFLFKTEVKTKGKK